MHDDIKDEPYIINYLDIYVLRSEKQRKISHHCCLSASLEVFLIFWKWFLLLKIFVFFFFLKQKEKSFEMINKAVLVK